jgi:magnesium chelatase subunit I
LATHVSKMRVVELPVSPTEDRVVGTVDIEHAIKHAIKHGEKKFEPGILAQANRNRRWYEDLPRLFLRLG